MATDFIGSTQCLTIKFIHFKEAYRQQNILNMQWLKFDFVIKLTKLNYDGGRLSKKYREFNLQTELQNTREYNKLLKKNTISLGKLSKILDKEL